MKAGHPGDPEWSEGDEGSLSMDTDPLASLGMTA